MKLWLRFWAVVAGLSGVKSAFVYVFLASGPGAGLLLFLSAALLTGAYYIFDLTRNL